MNKDALHTLLRIAGRSRERENQVDIARDPDPILPTPFRIGEASVTALAATGLAVSDLWKLRTGRSQEVAVDARQATASLRSARYLRLNGEPIPAERNALTGFYPALDDKLIYFHFGYPNHRTAALKVLGVEEDRQAIREAVARWDALELEEAINAAKGAGGTVRTTEEWSHHPQARAIASLPLMEIVKIGDSAPEELPEGGRPLSGIRVLDLTRVLAGPTCARTLAEHGADVLKITAAHLPTIDYQEYDTGHGKLSAYLDLRDQHGLETLKGLIREADVFSQAYRPGALGDRGLSPQAVAQLRPGIIYVSLSAFGPTGPWSWRRGFDTVVQTVSGIASRQGELFPGIEPGPQFYPVWAIDYLSGYLMAFGTLVALARRAREGGSWLVSTSLAQIGRWLVDLGQVRESKLKDVPREFTPAEVDSWSTVTDTPMGLLRHLAPVVSLSETPACWTRPSVPLGHHQPAWPLRRT